MDEALITLTVAEFHELNDEMAGICYACGEIDDSGMCEPDARDYPCAACGEQRVHGIDWALAEMRIDIAEED